jgi:hypothetical protein
LEEMASQLDLKADGTLDDMRRLVKEKWIAIEPFAAFSKHVRKVHPCN